MLENTTYSGFVYHEMLSVGKKIGSCNYKYCSEELYEGEGYEFDGFLYCSTSCIGEHLVEENVVVDLSA